MVVENSGEIMADVFTVTLLTRGSMVISSQDVTTPLRPGESTPVDFTWTPTEVRDAALKGKVIATNDASDRNDISPLFTVYIYPEGETQILIWDNLKGGME